jgi:MoxR-like ATPase
MYVHYGSSPRGVQTLIRAGKVAALLSGRYNVSLEDIRDMAGPALRHRIIMNLRAEAEGIDADEIIHDILKGVPERVRD